MTSIKKDLGPDFPIPAALNRQCQPPYKTHTLALATSLGAKPNLKYCETRGYTTVDRPGLRLIADIARAVRLPANTVRFWYRLGEGRERSKRVHLGKILPSGLFSRSVLARVKVIGSVADIPADGSRKYQNPRDAGKSANITNAEGLLVQGTALS